MQEQLWEGYKLLPNLKVIKLWDLQNLIKLPDFAGLVNVESFELGSCPKLQEIDSSFGDLEKLVFLSIEYCRGIKKFPSINGLKKLKTLSFKWCPRLENHHHTRFWFYHAHLTKLDLGWCQLTDEDIGSSKWELPHLQELDLSFNNFSRLDFGHWRLPRLKWLCVRACYSLVELSNLPSSIAVVDANDCRSLERFGDTSNCKWLWKVSNFGGKKLDPFEGERLINSMLQGNAIEDHFISLIFAKQIPKGGCVAGSFFGGKSFACLRDPVEDRDSYQYRFFRRDTFTLRLPDDWYNDFSGFLIRVVSDKNFDMEMEIIMKQEEEADEEDSRFEIWQKESDVQAPPEPEYDGDVMTCVGYVSFNSLRQTTSLSSSYNLISFKMWKEWSSFVAELVPVKSKDDRGVQTTKITTNCSEFQDEEADGYFRDYNLKNFKNFKDFQILHDSKSNIEIHWRTLY